jgi:hypothetical protein
VPFDSKAQQRFAYAHPEKFGGKKGLAEWSSKTDFSKLPERKSGSMISKVKKNGS